MKRALLILVSLSFVALFIFSWIEDGFSWSTLGGLLFFSICLLVALFEERLAKWNKKRLLQRLKASQCVLESDRIIFPKGYPFRQGYLKNKKELRYKKINEFRLNTNPMSVVINENEIIFLVGAHRDDCEAVAKREGIPIVVKVDVWSLICDDFLDTEFDEDYIEKAYKQLADNGLSKEEVDDIRSKIKTRMMAQTFLSLEWQYYGQYDVLTQLQPITEQRYWWTMEIALREDRNT